MIIIGSCLLGIILIFICFDGSFLVKKYNSIWSDKYIEQLDNDQSKMIAYGLRAASSHNTQPWIVKQINSNTIELYADMDKALFVVDGDFRQLQMSQGTFIESYKMGAMQYGYDVNIKYAKPNFNKEIPLIATIEVQKVGKIKELDAIASCTYSSIKAKGTSELEKTLDQCMSEYAGFSYTIIEGNEDVKKLENILLEGTVIESQDEGVMNELLNVFRWTEWEKNKYRFGLSLNSLPGVLKPFIQPIMKITSKNWKAFGESSIKAFNDRMATQDRYILIKCDSVDDLKYIYDGQIYQKLVFEVSDYNLRPAMQALESFDAMKNLNKEFQYKYGVDGEVVFIIGLQEKTDKPLASNPRHLVEDIIVK
jgi:hypothetical protein